MAIDWTDLKEILQNNQRFVLSSHVRPDADAIGSELGMAYLLRGMGKSVRIVNPSESPANLKFLDPEGEVLKIGDGISVEEICDTDVHIILDTSAWGQLPDVGNALKKSNAIKVVIDHHVSSDDLGAQEFKDTSNAATGMLVFDLAEKLGVEITPEMAVPLFCAIATDTGWYRFSLTTGDVYRAAGKLIDLGVQPHELYRQLYEQASLARIHLSGLALSRVTQDFAGRLAYTWVTVKDFNDTEARPADTENLVNECLKIEGAECAFIAVEQLNKTVKISFRSRSSVDVSAIAETFGGGGHRQASGATLNEDVESAKKKILAAFGEQLSAG